MASMSGKCDMFQPDGGLCPNSDWTWYEIVGVIGMVEWGIIHILAMVMLAMPAVKNDLAGFLTALCDNVPKEHPQLVEPYANVKVPPLSCRVLLQHALNLGWCGVFALVAPALMSSNCFNRFTFMWCLVPYMADWMYWVSIDVPEMCGLMSQAQTYIVSLSLFCIGYGVNQRWSTMPQGLNGSYSNGNDKAINLEVGDFEKYFMYIVPCLLFFCGVVQKLTSFCGVHPFACCICETVSDEDSASKMDTDGDQTGTC